MLAFGACKSKKATSKVADDGTVIEETSTTTVTRKTTKVPLEDVLSRQEEMYTTLGLTEKEKEKFRAIETKYAKEMRIAKDENADDKEAMYDALADIQEEKEGEIERLLTPSQFEVYKVELQKMREERREKRN
ncbi:MAG: hypothetical protein RLZZ337_80 [Bacteroidota bacterium]